MEYAIIIAVVVAALIAMRLYLVRALQEKCRQSADVFGEGEQYAKARTQVTEYVSSRDIADSTDLRDVCANVRAKVASLEESVASLLDRAASFEAQAVQMRQQAQISRRAGFANTAEQEAKLIQQAVAFENRAKASRDEAANKQAEIARLKTDYPECF